MCVHYFIVFSLYTHFEIIDYICNVHKQDRQILELNKISQSCDRSWANLSISSIIPCIIFIYIQYFSRVSLNKSLYNLLFLECSFSFLKVQILQLFLLDLLLQAEGYRHLAEVHKAPKINAHCHCRHTPFSMRETVRGELVVHSAICATLRFIRNRNSLIAHPQFAYSTPVFLATWYPSYFCNSSTHHLIYKYSGFTLFYDMLQKQIFEDTKHYYIIRRVRISPITNNTLFLTGKRNSL